MSLVNSKYPGTNEKIDCEVTAWKRTPCNVTCGEGFRWKFRDIVVSLSKQPFYRFIFLHAKLDFIANSNWLFFSFCVSFIIPGFRNIHKMEVFRVRGNWCGQNVAMWIVIIRRLLWHLQQALTSITTISADIQNGKGTIEIFSIWSII